MLVVSSECTVRYSEIPVKFRRTIELLRFFRRYGMLYMLDRFATTIDAQGALAMLREMASLVSRLKPQDGYCVVEKIKAEDREWYEKLGAEVEVKEGEYWIKIKCPELPDEDELVLLSKCIESMMLRPADLTAYAYAD